MAGFTTAAELDPTNDLRRREALRIARSAGAGPHLAAALECVSRLQERFPKDRYMRFVLAGLLTLSGEWTRARVLRWRPLYEALKRCRRDRPIICDGWLRRPDLK